MPAARASSDKMESRPITVLLVDQRPEEIRGLLRGSGLAVFETDFDDDVRIMAVERA